MSAHAPPLLKTCIGSIAADRPLLLTALVKRTYAIRGDQLRPHDAPEPIQEAPAPVKQADTGFELFKRMPEVTPDRDGCDLVVLAIARAPQRTRTREVVLEAPGIRKRLLVTGARHVLGSRPESLGFTEPEQWEEMRLDWDLAYGGFDAGIVAEEDWSPEDILRTLEQPPGAYPRNDIGRGFAVAGSTRPLPGLLLPNIEDPRDALTSGRLICPRLDMWHAQPRPAGFGFVEGHWFPRSLHMGVVAGRWPDLSRTPLVEQELGFFPRGLLEHQRNNVPELLLSAGYFNVAPPDQILRAPFEGRDPIMIRGLDSPASQTVIRLSERAPSVTLTVGAKKLEIEKRKLFQIVIDLERGLVTTLWGAQVPLDHSILASVKPEELLELPVQAA